MIAYVVKGWRVSLRFYDLDRALDYLDDSKMRVYVVENLNTIEEREIPLNEYFRTQ